MKNQFLQRWFIQGPIGVAIIIQIKQWHFWKNPPEKQKRMPILVAYFYVISCRPLAAAVHICSSYIKKQTQKKLYTVEQTVLVLYV